VDAKDGVLRNSPGPTPPHQVTDEQLATELKKYTGKRPVHEPVSELLGRHWEAAYSYARLCTDGAHPAGMLTTAAFTRLFEESARQSGPTAAWRPQLLVTIRRIAAEWDADDRRTLLHPELRSAAERGVPATARLLPPENRRIVARAFQRLAEPARCLLWHVEVEHEQLAAPAALLGLDLDDAAVKLERARELLREGCLDAHREFAPEAECRRYTRLLDVSLRRGNVLDPDLLRHMVGCAHCRHTAEQLDRFHDRLPILLAEGVLGWGARAYLASKAAQHTEAEEAPAVAGAPSVPVPDERLDFSAGPDDGSERPTDPNGAAPRPARTPRPTGTPRPARTHHSAGTPRPAETGGPRRLPEPPGALPYPAQPPGPPPQPPAADGSLRDTPGGGPRHSAAAHKAPRRATPRRRQLALAVLTVSAFVLVPLAVWSGSGGGDATSGKSGPSGEPSSDTGSESGSGSWVGAASEVPGGAVEGRLRNMDSGLCLGIDEKKAVKGAEAVLVSCTSSVTQRWKYETDGLLRSLAATDLCLDSHLGYSVQLAACAGESQPETKNVRYDFTLQGNLVPRWNQDLALTPASSARDAALVLKPRTDDASQRWQTDTSSGLRMQSVNWGTTTKSKDPETKADPSPTPKPSSTPAPTPTPTPSSSQSAGWPSYPGWGTCYYPYCPSSGQGGGYGSGGWGGNDSGSGRR